MEKLIVAKFGGSSVSHPEVILKACDIVVADRNIRVVVLSAMGKTTDQLKKCLHFSLTQDWNSCQQVQASLRSYHLNIIQFFHLSEEIVKRAENIFQQIDRLTQSIYYLKECSKAVSDHLCGFGEQLSTLIFTPVLQLHLERHRDLRSAREYSAGDLIITDANYGQANPLDHLTNEKCLALQPLFQQNQLIVTQGYIGKTLQGIPTTLGRGGSDYSAAILAAHLKADELQIWTDVDGLYTADPNKLPMARRISHIGYSQTAELAQMGAKVVHPLTLNPLLSRKIPIFVGKTHQADLGGTWILPETSSLPSILAIAHKEHQWLYTLKKIKYPGQYGFLAPIFNLLAKNHVSINLIVTTENTTSFTVDESHQLSEELLAEISAMAQIKWEKDFTQISIIGKDITQFEKIPHSIVSCLSLWPPKLLSLGPDQSNFSFLIGKNQAQEALVHLHDLLFESAPELISSALEVSETTLTKTQSRFSS